MAITIDKFVEVEISRETTQISTASFNIPLLVTTVEASSGDEIETATRVYTYSSADDVGERFGTTSNVYIMAQNLLGGTTKPSSFKVGIHFTTETLAESLAAIREVDDTWYAVIADSHTDADITAISNWVNSQRKLYVTSSQNASIPTSANDDIASMLGVKGTNQDRTALIYSPTADTDFPEAGWVGGQLPMTPGSNTWMFKEATGSSVARLTETQVSFLEQKNVNYYITVAGTPIFANGETLGNSWIDEIDASNDWNSLLAA